MVYSRTETHEGNDCLITKDAHIVAVYGDSGSCIGYVATCSTIYRGWMGQDSNSASKVFKSYTEAVDQCERYMKNRGLF